MRVGARLDNLGELVVDAAAKEVGANDDLIVCGKPVKNRCGFLDQVFFSIDLHRECVDVFALAGEQADTLDDSRREMSMGCHDKLPHSIPLSSEFRHKKARTHAPGQGAS